MAVHISIGVYRDERFFIFFMDKRSIELDFFISSTQRLHIYLETHLMNENAIATVSRHKDHHNQS